MVLVHLPHHLDRGLLHIQTDHSLLTVSFVHISTRVNSSLLQTISLPRVLWSSQVSEERGRGGDHGETLVWRLVPADADLQERAPGDLQ